MFYLLSMHLHSLVTKQGFKTIVCPCRLSVTRRVSLVGQELRPPVHPTPSPEALRLIVGFGCSINNYQCRIIVCLLVLSLLNIVYSVLRCTSSDIQR